MESENQNVKNGNGKVKNENRKAKWWSENQNVENENGKVKKKKTEISTEKLKVSHITDSTVYRQRFLNH